MNILIVYLFGFIGFMLVPIFKRSLYHKLKNNQDELVMYIRFALWWFITIPIWVINAILEDR